MTDNNCCCHHWDARECLRMRASSRERVDDRCECCCHYSDDEDEPDVAVDPEWTGSRPKWEYKVREQP